MDKYIMPQIIDEAIIELEQSILAASVVTEEVNGSVETVGQEVVEIDMTNHKWE